MASLPFVITIMGHEQRPLTDGDLSELKTLLQKHHLPVLEQEWLSPAMACDLFVEEDAAPLREGLDRWAMEHGLDVIAQKTAGRRKKLLCADMESTLIHQEMLEELAEAVGMRAKMTEITRRSMNGEIDFRASLQERIALLAGLSAEIIDRLAPVMTLMPGARELGRAMRKHGARCVIVSGGFTCFTKVIAGQLAFDAHHGNVLDIKDGKITGIMCEPVLDRTSKLAILDQTAREMGIALEETCAVGDGANDLAMLAEAGLGIAYHAKPIVQEKARHNIRFADLRGLLWAQGYRQADI
jgi:phosphoserine phosphatase